MSSPPSTEPLFQLQVRGYHREEVDRYLQNARRSVEHFAAKLSDCRADLAAEQRREAEGRAELHRLSEPPPSTDAEVAARIAKILRVGEEQRERIMTEGDAEIRKAKTDAAEEIERLLSEAKARRNRMRAAAEAMASDLMGSAHRDANELLADTRRRVVELSSRSEAHRLIEAAEKRARHVDEVAGRTEVVAEVHSQAIGALQNMIGVIDQLLENEHTAPVESPSPARSSGGPSLGVPVQCTPEDTAPERLPATAETMAGIPAPQDAVPDSYKGFVTVEHDDLGEHAEPLQPVNAQPVEAVEQQSANGKRRKRDADG